MSAHDFKGFFALFVMFPAWLLIGISALWFSRRVAPRALEAWCERNRVEVRKKWNPWLNFFQPFRDFTTTQLVFKITVRDRNDRARTGWMRIGSRRWFSYSVDQCPVEVEWDDAGPASSKKTSRNVDPDWEP